MIELNNISRIYDTGKVKVHALKNINLRIERGEFVAIMGHSGSGKSTLLNVLGFLDKPDSGEYKLLGKNIVEYDEDQLAVLRNRFAGFIFQQFHLIPWMTVMGNCQLPLFYAGETDSRDQTVKKIEEVGLSHRYEHYSNELSGGEQQRVAIARSLMLNPGIIFADEPTGNLDSKKSVEIMEIITRLNKEGKTIIIVTHEKDIAAYAGRIIYMRDGEIIKDRTVKKTGRNKEAVPLPSFNEVLDIEGNVSRKVSLNGRIFVNYLRQALHSVFLHKLRSFLSMLGVSIGVASVISMIGIGQGAKEDMTQRLKSLGSNLVTVRPGSFRRGHVSLEAGSVTRFTLQDVKAIAAIKEVKGVSPAVSGSGQLVHENKNWNSQVMGVGAQYELIRASTPVAGRFFSENDMADRKRVALVGLTVVKELFQNRDPVGEIMKINRIKFRVIGVLPEKGSSPHGDRDNVVIVPITTAMYRLLGKVYVDSIDVEIKEDRLIDRAKTVITDLIIKRHRLEGDRKDSFSIRDMNEIRQAISGTTKTLGLLLGAVAAISLVVGGIGIMNIMLVTVKERTKEIGLRKAIGARRFDIILQFILESSILTVCGGIVGIIAGCAVSIFLSFAAGWPIKIPPAAIALATVFSVVIGVFFGIWPAIQGSRLNPVEALRYE